MKKILILLFILPFAGLGQDNIAFSQGSVVQKNFCDTIPFTLVKSKMIVSVVLNGKSRKFLVDTGATLMISEEIQAEMKNVVLGNNYLIDISNLRKQMPVVLVRSLQLGNLTFRKVPAVVASLKKVPFLNCLDCDGIIGSNLLRNCIVQIDLTQKHLILTDHLKKIDLSNAFETPLRLDGQSSPVIVLKLYENLQFEALFDSGSDDFIGISPSNTEKGINNGNIKILNRGFGAGAIGINGIGAEDVQTRISIANVSFGKITINDFVAIVSAESNDYIGIELCEYGTVTIDYLNKKFYFAAKQLQQVYRNQKTLGFTIQPEANQYTVGVVWTGTEAEKSGLKSGNQILKIGDLDIVKRSPALDCTLLLADIAKQPNVTLTYKNIQAQVKTIRLNEE